MHLVRTRFAKDMVAEFLPPQHKSNKVVVFADSMPGYSSKRSVAELFSKAGYWFFNPRYRGTWESRGVFLKQSPHKDVLDVMNGIEKGFVDLYSGKQQQIKKPNFYLFGSSFGGPAVLLNSKDTRVKKVVGISSVVDWRSKSKDEPLDWLYSFVREAFGEGYRFTKQDWKKLGRSSFYNPSQQLEAIATQKILLIHAVDDNIVSSQSVEQFAKKTGSRLKLYKRGGHFGSSVLVKRPALWRQVEKFLSTS